MSENNGILTDENGNSFYPKCNQELLGMHKEDIWVYGDANTFYPVLLSMPKVYRDKEFAYHKVDISRGYSWHAPDTWNTATHRAGLTFSVLWTGDSSWGGNLRELKLLAFDEMYATTIAGYKLCTRGLIVWLRGGTARYSIAHDFGAALKTTIYYETFIDDNSTEFSPRTDSDSWYDKSLNKTIPKMNEIYPIGSVYMSVSSTNPRYLFGGTWTKIEGRFLWATGSTPKVTGGSKTTDGTALTIAQMPSHMHDVKQRQTAPTNVSSFYNNNYTGGQVEYCLTSGAKMINTGSTDNLFTDYRGGGEKHTHTFMPPYFEVYMWYRVS